MSAAASLAISGSTSSAPNTAATRPSVSARRFTRSTLLAKFGSVASALSPSTFFRQHAPLAVALDRDQDIDAVAALEHAIGRDRGVGEADALGRLAAFLLHQRHRHPVRHGVEQRDRQFGALAGAPAHDQRLEDRLVGVHAGADVAHRDADPRRLRRAAGDRGEPDLGLDQQIVGLALRVGAALAIARDRADDQPRMRRAAAARSGSRAWRPRRA